MATCLDSCIHLSQMQHGEIEAQGSHEELVQGDNSYKAMWQSMIKRDALVST